MAQPMDHLSHSTHLTPAMARFLASAIQDNKPATSGKLSSFESMAMLGIYRALANVHENQMILSIHPTSPAD